MLGKNLLDECMNDLNIGILASVGLLNVFEPVIESVIDMNLVKRILSLVFVAFIFLLGM